MAKPPISLEDLKQLEEDVHEKITNNASLKELDTLRNKIAHQLIIEDIKSLSSKERKNKTVNPTTQNNLSFTKINIQSSDHVNNPGEDSKIPVGSVKEINPPAEGSNKSSHSQIESSIKNKPTKSPTKFSHMLPNLESQLLERSKKEKRRDSLTGKSEKVSKSPEKKKELKTFDNKKSDKIDEKIQKKEKTEGKQHDSSKLENKSKEKLDSVYNKKSVQSDEKEWKSVVEKNDHNDKPEKPQKLKIVEELKKKETDDHYLKMNAKKDGDKAKLNSHRQDPRKKSEDYPKNVEIEPSYGIEISQDKTLSEKISLNKVKTQSESTAPVFKRLADKYNPKPKKHAEPEVDKVVSDIIEANMKISPPKIPILNQMPAPTPPPPSLIACAQVEPELPQPVQNITNSSTVNIINTVINQLRQNQTESEQARQASLFRAPLLSPPHIQSLMSPADPFISEYARPTVDTFVSEYVRDHNMMHNRPMFEPPELLNNQFTSTQSKRLNFIPPSQTHLPHLENFRTPMPYNQPHNTFNPPSMENLHKLDYYPPNAPINSNQYNCGPPILSPEIPHYGNEPKPNFGLMNNPTWGMEPNKPYWDHGNSFDNRYRGPATYREYREMRDIRDPRLVRNDPREIRDPRENRDPHENRYSLSRDPREYRNPRLNRDPRQNRDLRQNLDLRIKLDLRQTADSRENREVRDNKDHRDNRDSRENKDPRENEDMKDKRDLRKDDDRDQSRLSERSKFDSKFDRLYSKTNREKSPPKNKPKTESKELKDAFVSPLDSLYAVKEEHKTGKGYGVQNFRIPKLKKEFAEKDKIVDELENRLSEKEEEKQAEDEPNSDSNIHDESIPDYADDTADSNNVEIVEETNTNETNSGVSENRKSKRIRRNRTKKKACVDDNYSETDEKSEEKDQEQTKISEEKLTLAKEPPDPEKIMAEVKVTKEDLDPQVPKLADSEAVNSFPGNEMPKAPPEQTILAHFFTNLLSSQDKKEKKTALYSLINTFSDSFSPKELSKITKIIKADDDESSGDEETKKQQKTEEQKKNEEVSKEIEESEVLESKAKSSKTNKRNSRRRASKALSSPAKNDKMKDETTEKLDVETPEVEGVLVSVGERTKSQKRSPPKPRKKFRTELDMLHEDIQDMFIRDGVLTATGKRMCRLLKDDPTALTPAVEGTEETSEGSAKIRRKPGPKSKTKQSNISDRNSIKNMRVVISKIPDTTIEENKKRCRRLTRSMTFIESDEETPTVDEFNEPLKDTTETDLEENSIKLNDTDGESTDTEKDTASQTSEGSQKKSIKRKRGKRWASGYLNKKRRRDKAIASDQPLSSSHKLVNDTNTFPAEVDKEYYVDFTAKTYACKLCSFTGKFITSHYKAAHPESEILSSKFTPTIAADAIKDSMNNLQKYEESNVNRAIKTHYKCRFCCAETQVVPTIFYDHLSTHTGEYRHKCPCCNFSACGAKTLKVHIKNSHDDSHKPVIRKSYSDIILFGYMCGECNYIQMDEENVKDHVTKYHPEDSVIYKVNMSTIFDPQFEKWSQTGENQEITAESELTKATEIDETNMTNDNENITDNQNDIPNNEPVVSEEPITPVDPSPKIRKKAGPRSRSKRKISNSNLNISSTDLSDEVSTDDKPLETNTESSSVDKTPAPPMRRRKSALSMTLEEEFVPLRGTRAAKEKAQEKLKTLAEIIEGSVKKVLEISEVKNVKPTIEESPEDKNETKNDVAELKTKVKQEIDLNVFTCNTDINEENKKIEQERLQMMDELNKSVGNRTSLNFVDKLCNRLSQNVVKIKEEPHDDTVDNGVLRNPNSSPLTMPVLEKNLPIEPPLSSPPILKLPVTQAFVKKPVLDTGDSHLSNTNFDVTQKNDKTIINMIEKLKGKLGGVPIISKENLFADNSIILSDNDYDSEGPPPLTHVNELVHMPLSETSPESLLVGGLIKAIKTPHNVTFCCLVPPCVFSTDKQDAFQVHCKIAHKPKAIGKFVTLCESCDMEVKSTIDGNLLENVLKHTLKEHAAFLQIENEEENKQEEISDSSSSPRTMDTIPVPATVSKLRIRKLSGDSLSSTRDPEEDLNTNIARKEQPNCEMSTEQENESLHSPLSNSQETIPEPPPTFAEIEPSEDNPFGFKISGVMSLAETQPEVPPLAPLVKPPPNCPLVVKEAKMTQADLAKPRKTQKAMTKFIESVSDLYKCPHYYCLFTTNFRDFLERHLKAHQTEQEVMVPCVYCDLKTPWEHVPMHIDVRHAHCRFACSYCLYRAVVKEYVFLHQDQQHEFKDYSVIALPAPKTSKKFAIADPKTDPRTLCDPFKCTHCKYFA